METSSGPSVFLYPESLRVVEKNIVFICGLPRSGTTWVAKAFDAHPSVFYLHEPDTINRPQKISDWPSRDYTLEDRIEARLYFLDLLQTRGLKTVSSFPVFPKKYRSPTKHAIRIGLLGLASGIEKLCSKSNFFHRLSIPSLMSGEAAPFIVIKSVSSFNRVGLFSDVMPFSKFIFVARNPFGQISSMLRGEGLYKFEDNNSDVSWVLRSKISYDLGYDGQNFNFLPRDEQYAWQWAISTEHVMREFSARKNVIIVKHDDLSVYPEVNFENLFQFSELDFNKSCCRFLSESMNPENTSNDYYGISKNSKHEVDKWKNSFSKNDIKRLSDILSKSSMFRLFDYNV